MDKIETQTENFENFSNQNSPILESSDDLSASNSENFDLSDFFVSRGHCATERARPFSEYFAARESEGLLNYAREIHSASGPEVDVFDHIQNEKRKMIMMGSNDYLGFTHHPRIIKRVQKTIETWGVGIGGPPLLNGMTELHRQLESELAKLKGKEDALIFASGFQANLGWTNALLRSGDIILFDVLNHASLFDGIKLIRSQFKVRAMPFRHNDLTDLENKLKRASAARTKDQQIFVAVEGVYSMDGDVAPLPEITNLCQKYGAQVFVDDAHGTGVLGRNGSGTAEHFGVQDAIDLSMGTFSKVFGVTGGFIAGKKEVIDYLRYFSRSYMFSAHLPTMVVAAVLEGIEILKDTPALQMRLRQNAKQMRTNLHDIGLDVSLAEPTTPIIPVRIPPTTQAREVSKILHQEGIFMNVIETPAVPRDQERLRLSIMAGHQPAHLDRVTSVFKNLKEKNLL